MFVTFHATFSYVIRARHSVRGPSIYDVHTERAWGSGSGGRMWTGRQAPCGRPHRKFLDIFRRYKLVIKITDSSFK